MAKENLAPPVYGAGGSVTNFVTVCSGGTNSCYPRHSIKLWQVSRYPTPNGTPDPIGYNAAALEIIKDREPVYLEPRLKTVKGERTVKGSKNADNEYRRRDVERRTYQELSKYYRLPERKKEWTRPPLLVKGKHKHNPSTC